jgi:hypothetical protein
MLEEDAESMTSMPPETPKRRAAFLEPMPR